MVRRTQLYDVHRVTARMVNFAGFEMPLYYTDIAPEHLAVRNGLGMFDISHMGRVIVSGAGSERFLNYLITNDVSTLLPNSAQYSVMCNENGGILDDFVLYRLEADRFLVVFNAANREKDYKWFIGNAGSYDVKVNDVSDDVAMFAVQGPNAEKTLQKISDEDLSRIGRFKCAPSRLSEVDVFVSLAPATPERTVSKFSSGMPR